MKSPVPKKKITKFASCVYDVTSTIPCGKVTTYQAIATKLKTSSRAVGQALKKNPFAPQVPCHRVISSSRNLGGFFGATDLNSKHIQKKIGILEDEGVLISNNMVEEECIIRDLEMLAEQNKSAKNSRPEGPF